MRRLTVVTVGATPIRPTSCGLSPRTTNGAHALVGHGVWVDRSLYAWLYRSVFARVNWLTKRTHISAACGNPARARSQMTMVKMLWTNALLETAVAAMALRVFCSSARPWAPHPARPDQTALRKEISRPKTQVDRLQAPPAFPASPPAAMDDM